MTTLAAGASTTITLTPGQSLLVPPGGAGIAVLVGGPQNGTVYDLGRTRASIGAFDHAQGVSISASAAIVYSLQTGPEAPLLVTPEEDAAIMSLVSGGAAQPQIAYRLASFGDSRARVVSGGTQIGNVGSGAAVASTRAVPWAAAYLGDAVAAADFGVSGDTLISASASTGWNGVSRSNSKTFANLIAGGYDATVIQYGINDLAASATSAAIIAAAKAMVSALIATGQKVCLQSVMTFDPTAAAPGIPPAIAPATLVKINEFRDEMSSWTAAMPGVVFVDVNPPIALPNGYANPVYMTTTDTIGVHPNKLGAQLMGKLVADALRTLLPARAAAAYTDGPLYQPNFIEWGATGNSFAVNNTAGTNTATTPTWKIDSNGVPYVECVFTPTSLAGGTCQFALEVQATNIAGASPKWPVLVGDVLQGAARVVIDDGAGGLPLVHGIDLRQRLFNASSVSQGFNDWGGTSGASDLATFPAVIDGRLFTPPLPTPVASTNITTSAVGVGYYLRCIVETTALAPIRVRLYAPSLRVVSRPQPTTVTAGTSPYLWQNNPQPFVTNDWNATGRDVMVVVAPGSGGTISQIALVRGPTVSGSALNAVNTGATAGSFLLKPGDGVVVTWATTAAVITVLPQ